MSEEITERPVATIRNVVIEAQTGPCCGRRLWVRPGQRVAVGRTDAADFSLARDARVSSRHFQLDCDASQCRIRDLKSTYGTWLNGKRIEQAVLQDGDTITVGATALRVQIEPDSPPAPTGQSRQTVESEFVGDDQLADDQTPETPAMDLLPPETPVQDVQPAPAPQAPAPVALQQVCLEVVAGPEPRRKIWLQPPQKIVFGRTDPSDFLTPRDGEVSGRHFAVECDRRRALLRDLNSRNGTYVNGRRIAESPLADGDRIRAGRTEFVVRVEGGLPKEELEKHRQPLVKRAVSKQPWAAPSKTLPPLLGPATYARFPCRTGLWLYRGSQSRFQPGVQATRLAQIAAPCLVIDPAGLDDPGLIPADAPLLLPEREAAEMQATSPRLLCLTPDDKRLEQLVDRCWAQDALVCVYTRGDPTELIGQLQRFAAHHAAAPARTGLARLAPTALADFLANATLDEVATWREQADAVFLEAHQGERWAVFSSADFGTALQLIGLDPTPSWKS